jgi:3-phosphoshikimate 1-carboxyvinyltransferase
MQDCGIVLSYVEGPLLSIEGGQAYSPPDEFVVPNSMCEPSYYAIAGALCGKAEIIGMADSPAFIRLLDDFGVSYSIDDGTLRVSASQLESADIEVENHADFILQTMVLGAASVGKTTISGLPALSGTAKRRVAILSRELVRMGAKITIGESGMEIEGGWLTGGVETDPSGDPHVAMALSIASLAARTPSVVTDIDCIGKAHPNFLRDLANMGAIIREAADMGPQVGAPKKL